MTIISENSNQKDGFVDIVQLITEINEMQKVIVKSIVNLKPYMEDFDGGDPSFKLFNEQVEAMVLKLLEKERDLLHKHEQGDVYIVEGEGAEKLSKEALRVWIGVWKNTKGLSNSVLVIADSAKVSMITQNINDGNFNQREGIM